MEIGIYKNNHRVKIHEDKDKYLIEFDNGVSITVSTLDDITYYD